MHRPMYLHAIGLILVAALAAPASDRETERPNLVVILVDDLGYGDLSSYGAKDLRTPNIDRLAEEGIKLSHFRTNSNVCSPTRAAVLTGRYPELVGVPGVIRSHPANSWGFLAADAVLLPTAFRPAGYHSALVGKWHLGIASPNTPTERGFDFFHGFLGDMMDDYYNHLRHGANLMRRNQETITPKGHATDLFSDWSSAYLQERAKTDTPFFLYLAYNAPHSPVQPPREWLDRVTQRSPDIDPRRAKLVAFIEHLDDGIGKVLDTLRTTGLDRKTLVIFTSDNGGELAQGASNGATRDGKGSMYEGGLRVPFIARWPGKIKPGSSSDIAAATIDLYPTLLDAAGAKVTHAVDGISFLPALCGMKQPMPERSLFFTRREGGPQFFGKTSDALIRGKWKLLQNRPDSPLELYDLEKDPLEKENLAMKEREVFRQLVAELQRHIQRGGVVPWQAAPSSPEK